MTKAKKILAVAALGTAMLVFSFSASAGSHPRLYKLSRYKGEIGKKIKIKGKHFGKKKGEIIFGGEKVKIKKWRKSKITFYVPAVKTGETYKIRVCSKRNGCSRGQRFYVTRTGPEIWRIKNYNNKNNYQGVPGDKIRIKGRNFRSARHVWILFGDHEVAPIKRSKKKIYFYIPNVERDKTYSVRVTDGVNVSNAQDFYLKP